MQMKIIENRKFIIVLVIISFVITMIEVFIYRNAICKIEGVADAEKTKASRYLILSLLFLLISMILLLISNIKNRKKL